MDSTAGPLKYILSTTLMSFFGLLVGTFLATLFAMLAMGDDVLGFDPLRPWFLLYPQYSLQAQPDTLQTIWLLTGGSAFMGAVLGVQACRDGPLTQYDDSHFQTRRELRRNKMVARLRDADLVYGKTTGPKRDGKYISAPQDRFPHCLIVGPTGSGKNVSFVYPNLARWEGSAVVLDVKGANFAQTAALRQSFQRNEIFYFAPYDYVEDPDVEGGIGIRSHRFNPLARIAAMKNPEQQYSAINRMADHFLQVKSTSAESFFQAGRNIFVSCCLYSIEIGKPTLGEVLRIMMGYGASKKVTYEVIAKQTRNQKVADNLLAAVDTEDKILDSYVSVVRGAGLGLWDDPALDRATSGNDFDFATFRKTKQTLYIATPSDELKTMAPLIRLLFADAIASLQSSIPGHNEPYRVLLALDEFDQLGHQPQVLNSLKTIREFNGRFMIITQSIPGLEMVYDRAERLALMAAAGLQAFLAPQDEMTAEVLSKALGNETIKSNSTSRPLFGALFTRDGNINERSEERPLISPGKLKQMPEDELFILPRGQFPVRAKRILHYSDKRFVRLFARAKGKSLPFPEARPLEVRDVAESGMGSEGEPSLTYKLRELDSLEHRAESGQN